MKVLVCGNINSGKSYCIDLLTKIYPDFSIIQIDEWRKKYSDGTLEGEQKARQEFINAVINIENTFVELSGVGPLGKALSKEIESKSFIVLYIKESAEICLKRLPSKEFSNTPYPKFSETIEDTIKRIDKELLNGELQTLWKDKALSILEITNDYQISDIPLMHYKYLVDIIKKIKSNNRIRKIVLYGSFARCNLTPLSDIDMFITTDYSVRDIEKIFYDMSDCTFVDTTENKLTLMFNDILIEVVIVKEIQDNIKYYINSYIKDVSATIIKGGTDTYNMLSNAVSQFSPDMQELKSETIKRLIYFVISLERIAKKGDDYKFFFHNNIIIHEITRLLYFLNDKIEYNYLPNNALDYYAGINIKDLIYDFTKDKHTHIFTIKSFVKEILKKVYCNESKYFKILKNNEEKHNCT